MMMPKRTKWRKPHLFHPRRMAKRGTTLLHGDYGLVALEGGFITANQIEATRRVLARSFKKVGKVWIRIFPQLAVTSKPEEVRMGGGKGSPETWVAVVDPGKVMFEVGGGVEPSVAKEALKQAQYKLSIRTKIIEADKGGDNS
ncbi:MAG TPA: 50S ribosomal protein L16 [Thermodesulfobium narugense]|uniref:Large ribosomal subunit protein uL16 n=1 Tax=Thermodesulfobium acidiphilum TaxID=1794699 RepID=A0A2R4VZ87_THEAF|nr:50S ribosomal protein L16 [Thermodesulfobium acidiphilum]AWB09863.1 large subunit ribosomal protein L16 [Thermodesulfobium acidiphilum]HEM56530.1 50S ribosomal protein L16 [Thermodesulfobium narugense]